MSAEISVSGEKADPLRKQCFLEWIFSGRHCQEDWHTKGPVPACLDLG